MTSRRSQTRPDPRVFTAKTGDVGPFDPESSIISDTGTEAFQETSRVVGRTPYDLLHEHGITVALGKLIAETDPLELIIVTAYVLLRLFGKGEPVMRFWVFIGLLAGYHIVLKPLSDWLRINLLRPKHEPPNPTERPRMGPS